MPNSNPPDYSQSIVCLVSRTPGGLIAPDLYQVDFDAMAAGMLKIYFKNLEGFRPEVKKTWIQNLIGWKPAVLVNSYGSQQFEESGELDLRFNSWKDFNSNIIMLNYEDYNWNFENYMKFSVLDYPLMMERGYLPLRVDRFRAVDSFFGGFGLRTKGMPIKNATNTTLPTRPTNGTNFPVPSNPNVEPNEPLPPDPSVIPESSNGGAPQPPDPNSPDPP